jgi:tetratricopeptide (TPR) repeat protein
MFVQRSRPVSCRLPLVFLASALYLALNLAMPGTSAAATLFGVVYSESTNQRIVHAAVRLCDAGGTRLQESVTNDSGEFTFTGIPTGLYILKVESPGYTPGDVEINVDIGVQHGTSIFLRPVSQKAKNVAGATPISEHELSMPDSARKSMDAGKKKLYSDRNPTEALRDFQAAVAKAPDYYEAFYQIGMASLALQKPADAEKNLETAVTLSQQKFADADLALASLWLSRHDTTRGEPLLLKGLDLNPNSWTGYFELGKLELYRNRWDAALQAAEKAKSLAPEQAMNYRLLSLIHLRQKNDAAALADLDAYLRLDPDSPEAATAKKIRADVQARLDKPEVSGPANPQ